MWCPEGYYSWTYTLGTLDEIAEKTLSLVCLGGEPKLLVDGTPRLIHSGMHYLVKYGFADDEFEAELVIGITSLCLLVNFFETYPPILAGLGGNRIVPECPIFCHRDQFDLCYYDWPLKEVTPFSNFFALQKENGFGVNALFDRFAFINPDTGAVRTANGARHFVENGLGFNSNAADEMAEFAKTLNGYVLCWSHFPEGDELREFLSCIEADEIFTRALDFAYGAAKGHPLATQKRGIGRPKLRVEFGKAYFSVFPLGHEVVGKTWKEAMIEVETSLGRRIGSEATLKRGVEEVRQKMQKQ